MSKNKFSKKVNSYLYNHYWMKTALDCIFTTFMQAVSAASFAFGINVFLTPSITSGYKLSMQLTSGGSSGIATLIEMIFEMCGVTSPAEFPKLIFASVYVLVNIPLIILAFKYIGKRFAIFTLVNVGFAFFFSLVVFKGKFFEEIAQFVDEKGGLLPRALIAGMTTGLSSAIAFKVNTSAGGFDIVSYLFALKKNTSIGKYIITFNSIIIGSYYIVRAIKDTVLNVPQSTDLSNPWAASIVGILFTAAYMTIAVIVVDLINTKNKKIQLQIITSNKDMAKLLLAHIPHGATIVPGKGAFSGNDVNVIYMVISSSELKKVEEIIKEIDPKSFVTAINIHSVLGRFFIKPVK